MRAALLVALLLAGCADPGLTYRDIEPGPASGPYGGDGTIDMVVAYFSFETDGEAHGNMGSHCGFSSWSLDPPSAKVHIHDDPDPATVVMRQIHPDQSTEGIAHFGTAPTAYHRHHDIPRAFGSGTLGTVTFQSHGATFDGIGIPTDRWVLVDRPYTSTEGEDVVETLHLRHFPAALVEFDREERVCF